MHRRPELRGRPVVVAGDPDGRGVVATASYAARRYGIHSAMSAAEARRRCPDAAFVRPDHSAYREWSARVWELARRLAPCVEVVGLDEGYIEVPDDDAVAHAREIQAAVRREVRLSVSLGLATCKVVAKVASDRDKPGGLTVVPPGEEAAFLAPLPLRALPGAGPRTEERLARLGIATIGDLAGLDDDRLAQLAPGRAGEGLRRRARGIDERPVAVTASERISMSTERTFATDLRDRAEIERRAREMAAALADGLRRRDRVARTVTVKLRYPDFATVTRGQTLRQPTDEAPVIARLAVRLVTRALVERDHPLRLLGVGVSGLSAERQLTLFPQGGGAAAEGPAAITRGPHRVSRAAGH